MRGTPAMEWSPRSEEHTSELQSRLHLVCRLLLEKKKDAGSTSTACSAPPEGAGTAVWARGARVACRPSLLAGSGLGRWTVPFAFLCFFLKKRAPPKSYPFPPHGAFRS